MIRMLMLTAMGSCSWFGGTKMVVPVGGINTFRSSPNAEIFSYPPKVT